jgi:cobalt-precorrin-5B (C1)-methyltransferase
MSDDAPRRPDAPLRSGWTTGACAAAAAKAAFEGLHAGRVPTAVTIRLPRGERPSFAIAESALGPGWASAGVIKDAGDDPDVTHGALVRVTLSQAAEGIDFRAGEGVGMVTRAGLPIPPGQPAINPGPRAMITEALADIAESLGVPCAVTVTIAIPGGEKLAERTLNGRLGIVGGLSILGTSGIVTPYSCAAWVHTIHRGIDVAIAAGQPHILGATGSTSEAAAQALLGLPDLALIDMGDFVGGMLKYLRKHPVPRVTIAGGFAKLAKLAQGHLDLHSGRSRVDVARLSDDLRAVGAPAELVEAASQAVSAGELLELASDHEKPLCDRIAQQAVARCRRELPSDVAVDLLVFNRAGRLIGHA